MAEIRYRALRTGWVRGALGCVMTLVHYVRTHRIPWEQVAIAAHRRWLAASSR